MRWQTGFAALTLVFLCTLRSDSQQVTLPVEVVGQVGVTQTVNFTIPAGTNVAQYPILYMRAHSLGYADKAAVSLNGGAWLTLNNTTCATIDPAAKAFGGIGGSYNTIPITMPLPAGSLHVGANTIAWKLNKTDYVSISYRILAFNFRTSLGADLLPATTFVQDDPNRWVGPYTDPINIAAGGTLWRTATLKASNAINAPPLRTHCLDCHAKDGRDLKYFNYSNNLIIERSKFHGLNATQGMQIASYIRALQVPNPGRPWNPPYQPGPGLDSGPLQNWAAGAGIDWALTNDGDSLQYLFPGGNITAAAVATSGTLSMREVPVALQLPDWNHWLPRAHPLDSFGALFTNSSLGYWYGTMLRHFGALGVTAFVSNNHSAQQVEHNMTQIGRDMNDGTVALGVFLSARRAGVTASQWTPTFSEQLFSTAQWQLVTMWDFMQTYQLEGSGKLAYGPNAESRTWYSNAFFQAAPGIVGIPFNPNGIGGSALSNLYLTVAWYHVQTVLDTGNRHQESHYPIDWTYVMGTLKNLDVMAGRSHGILASLYLAKTMQNQDNGIGPEHYSTGWDPSHAGDMSVLVDPGQSIWWTQTNATIKKSILQALLTNWVSKSKQFTPTQYYLGGVAGPTELLGTLFHFPDKVALLIRKSNAWGVDPSVVSDLRGWAKTVWPAINWNVIQ